MEHYSLRIGLQEAQDHLAAFDKTYPQLAEWKRRNADICKSRGYVRISAGNGADEGRIHRFSWNAAPKSGAHDKREFSYTQSCNLPVLDSCADASMLALTLIDKALSDHGIPGGPVIWCHDEIVLEVPAGQSAKAAVSL